MTAYKRILVPTDFGEAAQEAANHACLIAAKFGATVTLLHVWMVPMPAYAEMITFPLEEVEAAAREALRNEAKRVSAIVGDVQTVLVPGAAWRSIVEEAEKGYDLVVVGTHGRRGVPRLLLGSVAEMVVRASPVPVLTVRTSA